MGWSRRRSPAAFRHFLAKALDISLAEETLASRRGGRRMVLFERTFNGGGPPPKPRRRLVNALWASTTGEAVVTVLDVANVVREEARMAVLDTADALVDRFSVVDASLGWNPYVSISHSICRFGAAAG